MGPNLFGFMAEAAPKGFGLALSVAVVAVFLAVGAIAFAYVGASTQVNNLSSQVNTLQTQIPGLIAKSGLASVNATPATMAFRVDWCNTDNTGQDRFCPPVLIVHQGDLVQILFETNDTDAHTFTLVAGGYNLQLNNTYGASGSSGNFSTSGNGMHNFLTNGYFQASCVQAPYSQASTGLSSSDCVSGSSLLAPGGTYKIFINPNPASSPLPPATPEQITVDNQFHFIHENGTANAVWSIASFRASIPGIFEFYCYYHVSNGMFAYLIVLPNTYCNTHTAACTSTSNTNPT
jgi:plastocyanin